MIKIYYSDNQRPLPEDVYVNYLNSIPADIRKKVLRFRRWQDAQASLLGKLLVKKGLEDHGTTFGLDDLRYTRHGRPYVESRLDFNTSHSGGYVVCAFSVDSRIGVDIEEIKPVILTDFMSQFRSEEWDLIQAAEDTHYAFYNFWTAKEAAVKADGKGLNIPLKDIGIAGECITIYENNWRLRNIPFHADYLLQIVSDRPIPDEIELIQICFNRQ